MKYKIACLSFFVFTFISMHAQCVNLGFRDIYALWLAYNNGNIEDSLLAKGAEKVEENVHGICYSEIAKDETGPLYNYNEMFQSGQAMSFNYGTFNREAYTAIENYITSNFRYTGTYRYNGINFRFYYYNNFYCSLAQMDAQLSKTKKILLYALDFNESIPGYYIKVD